MENLKGKVVVFTGKISKPRHEFQRLVEELGGIAGSDVSKNTDYLVVGEKPGSKLFRATQLGVKIISEQELYSLIESSTEEEIPLTVNELAEVEKHIITLTCSYCKRTYKQFDNLPNYGTCPVCEILSNPICPHCKNEPIFVTDYNLYHCMLCGTWFKAPSSLKARITKHLCYFKEIKRTSWGVSKSCLACNNTISLTNGDLSYHKELYEKAPALVTKWTEERKKGRVAFQAEENRKELERKAFAYFKSLTPEQIKEIENGEFLKSNSK